MNYLMVEGRRSFLLKINFIVERVARQINPQVTQSGQTKVKGQSSQQIAKNHMIQMNQLEN